MEIEQGELDRICVMLKGDEDMRELAISLLGRNTKLYSISTILILHFLIFVLSMVVGVLAIKYGGITSILAESMIIILMTVQLSFHIYYVIQIALSRTVLNKN